MDANAPSGNTAPAERVAWIGKKYSIQKDLLRGFDFGIGWQRDGLELPVVILGIGHLSICKVWDRTEV